jgi:hypothetical protein
MMSGDELSLDMGDADPRCSTRAELQERLCGRWVRARYLERNGGWKRAVFRGVRGDCWFSADPSLRHLRFVCGSDYWGVPEVTRLKRLYHYRIFAGSISSRRVIAGDEFVTLQGHRVADEHWATFLPLGSGRSLPSGRGRHLRPVLHYPLGKPDNVLCALSGLVTNA